jgi:CO/xanthine dehydrogenase Mo-binding subunit
MPDAAVRPASGEVRVLRSVQAVDAGTVLNPAQLRGQVEGGVAQAFGSALYENIVLEQGVVVIHGDGSPGHTDHAGNG